MIVGPFIGGIITKQFNEQTAAFVAAGLSVFSILSVLKLVPKNTKVLTPAPKGSDIQGKFSIINGQAKLHKPDSF